jgi:DnaJ-class molecular chaperone
MMMVCKQCFGLGRITGEFDDCPYCDGKGFAEDPIEDDAEEDEQD